MANIDQAFGLRPIAKVGSAPGGTTGTTKYSIADNQGTAIFTGDPVKYKNDGTVEVATAGDPTCGIFTGCFYTDPTTKKPTFSNFYPGGIAASDITAFVIDDPDAVFLVDADEAFTRADLYKNYSVTNTTGVTTTGLSKQQLDVSVSGTATTFAIQAIDICQDPENSDTGSANANILVRINNHFYRSGTGIA